MAYYNPEPTFEHGDPLKVGILLANLGTPDAPTAKALKPYLQQFLHDRRVVEIPRFIWCWILHCIILVIRPKKICREICASVDERGFTFAGSRAKANQTF